MEQVGQVLVNCVKRTAKYVLSILSNDGQSNVSRQICTSDLPIEINPVTTCDDKQDKNLMRLEEKVTGLEKKVDQILLLLNSSSSTEESVKYPSSPLLHSCEEKLSLPGQTVPLTITLYTFNYCRS